MGGRRSTLLPSHVRCPKCGANAHATRVRQSMLSNVSVAEVHCMICGTRRYGDEAERIIAEAVVAERVRTTTYASVEASMRRTHWILPSTDDPTRRPRQETEAVRPVAPTERPVPTGDPPARDNAERERAVQTTPPPKTNRLPREEVVAAARSIASREDLMPTNGPSEPHTITAEPPVEPRYDFDVASTPLKVIRAAARTARVAELGGDASTLCASPWCCNRPLADRRYCSKSCSDDVARARYKARKASTP